MLAANVKNVRLTAQHGWYTSEKGWDANSCFCMGWLLFSASYCKCWGEQQRQYLESAGFAVILVLISKTHGQIQGTVTYLMRGKCVAHPSTGEPGHIFSGVSGIRVGKSRFSPACFQFVMVLLTNGRVCIWGYHQRRWIPEGRRIWAIH